MTADTTGVSHRDAQALPQIQKILERQTSKNQAALAREKCDRLIYSIVLPLIGLVMAAIAGYLVYHAYTLAGGFNDLCFHSQHFIVGAALGGCSILFALSGLIASCKKTSSINKRQKEVEEKEAKTLSEEVLHEALIEAPPENMGEVLAKMDQQKAIAFLVENGIEAQESKISEEVAEALAHCPKLILAFYEEKVRETISGGSTASSFVGVDHPDDRTSARELDDTALLNTENKAACEALVVRTLFHMDPTLITDELQDEFLVMFGKLELRRDPTVFARYPEMLLELVKQDSFRTDHFPEELFQAMAPKDMPEFIKQVGALHQHNESVLIPCLRAIHGDKIVATEELLLVVFAMAGNSLENLDKNADPLHHITQIYYATIQEFHSDAILAVISKSKRLINELYMSFLYNQEPDAVALRPHLADIIMRIEKNSDWNHHVKSVFVNRALHLRDLNNPDAQGREITPIVDYFNKPISTYYPALILLLQEGVILSKVSQLPKSVFLKAFYLLDSKEKRHIIKHLPDDYMTKQLFPLLWDLYHGRVDQEIKHDAYHRLLALVQKPEGRPPAEFTESEVRLAIEEYKLFVSDFNAKAMVRAAAKSKWDAYYQDPSLEKPMMEEPKEKASEKIEDVPVDELVAAFRTPVDALRKQQRAQLAALYEIFSLDPVHAAELYKKRTWPLGLTEGIVRKMDDHNLGVMKNSSKGAFGGKEYYNALVAQLKQIDRDGVLTQSRSSATESWHLSKAARDS